MTRQTLVIVPTYNEAENIADLVETILHATTDVHVLIVDDNSPDGTGEIAHQLGTVYPNLVYAVHRAGKLGLGTAYCAGFRFGLERGYTHFVTMDADFSHPPQRQMALIEATQAYDVAIGSRYVAGGEVVGSPLSRRLLSRGANTVASTILRLPAHDCTAGLRCYRRTVLETIDFESILSDGYSFLIEMLYHCRRAGFRVCEIPITFRDRAKGKSKISEKEIYNAAFTLLRLRTPFVPWRRLVHRAADAEEPVRTT